jgi:oxygen-independent coproporphyrinogen-3 oxidase
MINSVYVHIPFCVRKCLYCDFNSHAGMEHLFTPYVEALKTEIRREAERFPDARISTIYFGGGTPNILAPDQLAGILDEIRRSFEVATDAEISIEANPGVSSLQSTVSSLPRVGFSRLSPGVQSFNDDELRLLGRIHTADEAVRAFRDAREAGFENISIDLMYGIPGQTLESWRATLDKALDLAPEHVSLYSLTVEEGTPFHAMQVEGRLTLPGDEIEADMYEEAIRTLTSAGFEHYEISNFARPGFRCRHNITYWHNEPYFGFGAGATGYLPELRSKEYKVQRPAETKPPPRVRANPKSEIRNPKCGCVRATNVLSPEEYISRIEAGESPKACEERLTGRAAMGETMFLGLRMLQGVDIETFARRNGVLPQEVFFEEIADLAERGLIEEADGAIRLTPRGLLLANDVFAEFVS